MIAPEITNVIARWSKECGVKQVGVKLRGYDEGKYRLEIYTDRPGFLIGKAGCIIDKYTEELKGLAKEISWRITEVEIHEIQQMVGQEEIDLEQYYKQFMDYDLEDDGEIMPI
ncbi:MAG: hypothetical protein Q4C64_08450 [Erysipelotrichia bacterium]|nr:hypothetical protein [Erysipelotrichia bacterium]